MEKVKVDEYIVVKQGDVKGGKVRYCVINVTIPAIISRDLTWDEARDEAEMLGDHDTIPGSGKKGE